jgi:hypothetical protein
MKKIFFVWLVFISNIVLAQETIVVMNALSPSHSGTVLRTTLISNNESLTLRA